VGRPADRRDRGMSVADTEAAGPVAPAVVARGIAMTGRWGTVFGPLDLDIAAGGVTVLVGPTGLGCTALLLTLAARMRPLRGIVRVLGHAGASQIFRIATPAALGDLDTVDDSVTVTEVVTEQLRWNAPWCRAVPRAGGREVDAMCRSVFGPLPSPPGSAFVRAQRSRPGIAAHRVGQHSVAPTAGRRRPSPGQQPPVP